MKDSCSQQYPIMTILLTIVIHPSNHFYQIHLSSILFLSNHLSSIHFNPVIHHLSINSYSCISFMNSYHLSILHLVIMLITYHHLPSVILVHSSLFNYQVCQLCEREESSSFVNHMSELIVSLVINVLYRSIWLNWRKGYFSYLFDFI